MGLDAKDRRLWKAMAHLQEVVSNDQRDKDQHDDSNDPLVRTDQLPRSSVLRQMAPDDIIFILLHFQEHQLSQDSSHSTLNQYLHHSVRKTKSSRVKGNQRCQLDQRCEESNNKKQTVTEVNSSCGGVRSWAETVHHR